MTIFENLAFVSWFLAGLAGIALLLGSCQLCLYGFLAALLLAQAAGISKCHGIARSHVLGFLYGSLGPWGLLLLPASGSSAQGVG
ncbi:MAG: hypothetical protein ACOCXA_04515 [Planctomycetota bacterium]